MLFLPWRDEERDLTSTFDTYQEHYVAKHLFILSIRNKYKKYKDILEQSIDDIKADEKNLDDIFDDFEGEDLEQHIDISSDTEEYIFYDLDRPEEHRHHDIGSDLGITTKYIMTVNVSGFTATDGNYNKVVIGWCWS